ncbi:MAG: hypothetical protein ACYCY7_08000 [Gallionella sp.]
MENRTSVKLVTYAFVTSLLFLGCPDRRSSDEIADEASAEDLSIHQEYDADSMPAYYDPR